MDGSIVENKIWKKKKNWVSSTLPPPPPNGGDLVRAVMEIVPRTVPSALHLSGCAPNGCPLLYFHAVAFPTRFELLRRIFNSAGWPVWIR